jgi:hypothetical protein
VHEIAALSWFFYIKVKEQENKSIVSPSKNQDNLKQEFTVYAPTFVLIPDPVCDNSYTL